MANLFDLATTAYNFDNMEDSYDDTRDYLNTGFNNARQDTLDINQPYLDMGTWGNAGYKGLGEFDYTYGDYLGSDNYDWLVNEGLRGVERTASADGSLYSGKTLADLNERNINMAQSMYSADHARELAEFGANQKYYGFGTEIGQKTAADTAETLGDLSIAKGGAMAGLEMNEQEQRQKILASLFGGEGGTTTGSIGSDITSLLSGAEKLWDKGGEVVDWAKNFFGSSAGNAAAAAGAANGVGAFSGANALGNGSAAMFSSAPTGAASFGGSVGSGVGSSTLATGDSLLASGAGLSGAGTLAALGTNGAGAFTAGGLGNGLAAFTSGAPTGAAAFGGSIGANVGSAALAPSAAAPTAGASLGFNAATLGAAGGLAMIPVLKAISGSGTGNWQVKTQKLAGDTANYASNVDKLLTGGLWYSGGGSSYGPRPEFDNAQVIGELVKAGALSRDDPRLVQHLADWGNYYGSPFFNKGDPFNGEDTDTTYLEAFNKALRS